MLSNRNDEEVRQVMLVLHVLQLNYVAEPDHGVLFGRLQRVS